MYIQGLQDLNFRNNPKKSTSVLVVGCLDITALICSAWPFVTTSATTPFSSSIPESLEIKNDNVMIIKDYLLGTGLRSAPSMPSGIDFCLWDMFKFVCVLLRCDLKFNQGRIISRDRITCILEYKGRCIYVPFQ